jgi:hypothetical protein
MTMIFKCCHPIRRIPVSKIKIMTLTLPLIAVLGSIILLHVGLIDQQIKTTLCEIVPPLRKELGTVLGQFAQNSTAVVG